MLDETNLDEDLDTDTDPDTIGGMVVIGYALAMLFGAAVATVFWAVVWAVAR